MATEIERKFLITGDGWRKNAERSLLRQGYICAGQDKTVRVRLSDNHAWLTIKGKTTGAARAEFEYKIPESDAQYILDQICVKPFIEKYRYKISYSGLTWVIDEFLGDNEDLIIAEVELEREDQIFEKPDWAGSEVTGDPKYYNASLISNPYKNWKK